MNLPAHIITCHTIHEPTRSWHSISRSKQSIIVSQTTHQEAKNNSVSAWLGPLAARRNCSKPPGGIHSPPGDSVLPDPTVFSSPPGGVHRAARRPSIQRPLTLVSPPGASTRAARRRISSRTPLEAKNNSVSAWLGPLAARRNCSKPPGGIHSPLGASVLPDPTVFSSPPGGVHCAARRPSIQRPLTLVSPPGASTRAARRRISSRTPLVFKVSINLLYYVTQFQVPK
ncbi:hypothetical protein DEO72_LG8g1379 [Vigna unguiculata]|uniref:Uncharacterized protein n=1 Tax=Vigna unguiculata TaxID=3917 RepID=A0A4D6MTZ4_VIGUN|nr:hypothetical protein DEO72_LG8g1379 [Vigna unguiculata]